MKTDLNNKKFDRVLHRYKRVIDPFASLYCKMIVLVSEMPTKKLKYILKNQDLLSNTNCWWAQFSVLPHIIEMVEFELIIRENKKKEKNGKTIN